MTPRQWPAGGGHRGDPAGPGETGRPPAGPLPASGPAAAGPAGAGQAAAGQGAAGQGAAGQGAAGQGAAGQGAAGQGAAGQGAAGQGAAAPEAAGPPGGGPPAGLNTGPTGGRSRLNSGGLIYGTLVAAVAVAIGSSHGNTPGDLEDAMLSTVIIYWLAHVYTATVSGRRPGEGPPLWQRAWAAARHETPILVGGVPLLVLVLALWLAGVSVNGIAVAALCVAIGVLAVEGVLAARQAGVTGWRVPAEALGAAVFGALIGLLMAGLHS